MNNKVMCLFTIFLAVIITMGVASATDLESHDFDDYFSMDVPQGTTFQKEDSSINDEFKMDSVGYMSDSLGVFYIDTQFFLEYTSYSLYQMMFENINVDLTKCYESQEGNLRILEPTTNDGVHFSLVGTSSGNKMVVLMGNDVSLLKEMGHTIEFN